MNSTLGDDKDVVDEGENNNDNDDNNNNNNSDDGNEDEDDDNNRDDETSSWSMGKDLCILRKRPTTFNETTRAETRMLPSLRLRAGI